MREFRTIFLFSCHTFEHRSYTSFQFFDICRGLHTCQGQRSGVKHSTACTSHRHGCFPVGTRHWSFTNFCKQRNIHAGPEGYLSEKMSKLTLVSSNKCFGGEQRVYSHESSEVGCTMKFGVFLPAEALAGTKLPVVVWLSGLTCTEQNFITKAGAQRSAADLKLIVVNPDTSPRGVNIEGEDDSYDFGSGAGFYVDATTEKWKKNYRMYSYVTKEFLSLVHENFSTIPDRQSIFGHSMGGHGALVIALKNPGLFRSVSAFAPISNPMECPWGQKCLSGYLGEDKEAWKAYDAAVLVRSYNGPPLDILVDQGSADNFLPQKQLLPENLVEACKESNVPIVLRSQEGYDHSYFFMASFMEDHLRHHAKNLHN